MKIDLSSQDRTVTIAAESAVEFALLREVVGQLQESGKLEMPSHLSEVLALFERHPNLSASDVLSLLKSELAPSAMSNRLIRLRRMGLLARVAAPHPSGGREFIYRLAPERDAEAEVAR